MKDPISEKEWLNEFNEFFETPPLEPPQHVSSNILKRIKKQTNPSPWVVFIKLLGIHSIIGTLSLAICSQFDLNPFNTPLSLSDYFMTFGHSVCMTLCGVIFIGLSFFAAWIVLNKDQFNVVKNNYFIQAFALCALSLGMFVALGAHLTLGIAGLWIIGALIGGAVPVWFLSPSRISI